MKKTGITNYPSRKEGYKGAAAEKESEITGILVKKESRLKNEPAPINPITMKTQMYVQLLIYEHHCPYFFEPAYLLSFPYQSCDTKLTIFNYGKYSGYYNKKKKDKEMGR